jgi:hypothetical protein
MHSPKRDDTGIRRCLTTRRDADSPDQAEQREHVTTSAAASVPKDSLSTMQGLPPLGTYPQFHVLVPRALPAPG